MFDARSRILILGSFPSVKSREAAFFYGHPQNRFWPLLGRLLDCEIPPDVTGRRQLLLERGVALWDVLEACDIIGSDDASIRSVQPVDILRVLDAADIRAICCNGATAHRLFTQYLQPVCGRDAVKLPSTSPANAAWSPDRLYEAWSVMKPYLTKDGAQP